MMKRLKKWALVFGLAGPTVASLSCSSTVAEQFRDAAISGAASFVEQATIDLLSQAFFTGETVE
jgi:hypothetical protein